jgi:phage shock protein A
MPGTTGRVSTAIKAKISSLLNRAEKPAETLDYAYERQLGTCRTSSRGSRAW